MDKGNFSKHANRYSSKIKLKAKSLRNKGLTHREIKEKLGIGLGTVFVWTQGIILTSEQKKAIEERRNKRIWTEGQRIERGQLARINLSPYWKKPYSKKELLAKIKKFYLKNGRIPFKREFNSLRVYRARFGTWNNAIRAAGFEPNPVIFSKKFTAKDGHICDSYAEKIVDDWLFRRQIKHERNIPYKNTKMTADFTIGNIRIEYFGLAGRNKLYDKNIKKKQKFCQKEKLKLIEIYPTDLFLNRLSKIINLKELKR